MKAPQIILLALYALSLGTHLANHGKPKTGTYDFWSALTSFGLVMVCLVWGGFFA